MSDQKHDEAQDIRRAIIEALARRHGGPDQAATSRLAQGPYHDQPSSSGSCADRDLFRASLAVLLGVAESEVSDEQLDDVCSQIAEEAAENATRLAAHLDQLAEHLQSIGCIAVDDIEAYFAAARRTLVDLYATVSVPQTSPAQLMRLALQYALDPRRPIEGDIGRFELRRTAGADGTLQYELAEYPSTAIKTATIPLPGTPVRDPVAVFIFECLSEDAPPLFRLMQVLEQELGCDHEPDVAGHLQAADAPAAVLERSTLLKWAPFAVDLKASTITVGGITHRVDLPELLFADAVQAAQGQWVPKRELQKRSEVIGERPDRLRKKLPPDVNKLIQSQAGRGYRLRVELLA